MAETDDIVASLRAWAPLVASGYTVPAAGQVMENAATALTGRDAQIERLTAEKDAAERELKRILDAIEVKGGSEHAPTEWAYQAACDAWRKRLDLHREAEARATTAERDLAEARAEVERFRSERSYIVGFNDGFAEAVEQQREVKP